MWYLLYTDVLSHVFRQTNPVYLFLGGIGSACTLDATECCWSSTASAVRNFSQSCNPMGFVIANPSLLPLLWCSTKSLSAQLTMLHQSTAQLARTQPFPYGEINPV